MNKKCFRVIFSKTLQRLIVTSELAKAEGKAKESNSFSDLQIFARIRPLVFSLFCALGLVSTPTLAETLIIQADKSAPKHQQPIILQTANGLPQVNIQTPNDKGLSHNKYSKFDVDTKGAILNNSRTNVQTQQAGWVQGKRVFLSVNLMAHQALGLKAQSKSAKGIQTLIRSKIAIRK